MFDFIILKFKNINILNNNVYNEIKNKSIFIISI